MIEEHSIEAWVEGADSAREQALRMAVHTTLLAISDSNYLRSNMVLKGGILLAIRYQTHRHTTDIDLSTTKQHGEEINEEAIKSNLESSLVGATDSLSYDMDCRIQSIKKTPKSENATFPSLKITIGYAQPGSQLHKRLMRLECPTIISIDYSMNEALPNIESIKISEGSEGNELLVYTLTDLIAEKFRSLLQQPSRNRHRRQDAYDLNIITDNIGTIDNVEKNKILSSLLIKCKARDVAVDVGSMDNPDIYHRAKVDYATLDNEIEIALPDFDTSFIKIVVFYRSLPWD
jgi:predicted nucleotidyltransferase component of viral defense system